MVLGSLTVPALGLARDAARAASENSGRLEWTLGR
jgi:hypothetical protein